MGYHIRQKVATLNIDKDSYYAKNKDGDIVFLYDNSDISTGYYVGAGVTVVTFATESAANSEIASLSLTNAEVVEE